ncbi:MAG: CoA pyrophosphatase [Rhodospirillaceae bacterium]|jgi:8-oxo-dGTP pyrophosphatase MutT (NUDIX family)|nr:CoA pyrophosphatase [Rhodospirillaceae bacterium]MBT4041993.1 CoA pyrophosphatase [Rhodospirillaceae bacterium]MBT4688560.1 CoA pyrophosphatase [Rhodospirillaceae bacterium]MBT5083045.1 CoA pyrophosphatase [Rhodospirillaceae bacterium]MBT5524489.1 CoA pyrophosphatase [Rhodospirillaceae bacterium]
MTSTDFPYTDALRQRFTDHLTRFERQVHGTPDDGLKHAAVTMTLIDDGTGQTAFILTRRTPRLSSHAGQKALPGGRVDAGESATQAGLRELSEEINLHLGEDAVLGLLDDYPTRSGYVITPMVIWAGKGATMSPNPDEVAKIMIIPLADLIRPDSPEFITIPESDRPVLRVLFGDDQVNAPTAVVIYQFAEVVMAGRDIRVDHLEQPVFAWK